MPNGLKDLIKLCFRIYNGYNHKIKNKQVVEEILPPVFNWIENENEMLIQHYVLIFVICVFCLL